MSLERLDLDIEESATGKPRNTGYEFKEPLTFLELNWLLKITNDNIAFIADTLGLDLSNVIFDNKKVLDEITSAGTGIIITDEEREKLESLNDYTHPNTHPGTMIIFDPTGTDLESDRTETAIKEVNTKLNGLPASSGKELLSFGIISIADGLPNVIDETRNVYWEAEDSGTIDIDGTNRQVKTGDWLIYYGADSEPYWDIKDFGSARFYGHTTVEEVNAADINLIPNNSTAYMKNGGDIGTLTVVKGDLVKKNEDGAYVVDGNISDISDVPEKTTYIVGKIMVGEEIDVSNDIWHYHRVGFESGKYGDYIGTLSNLITGFYIKKTTRVSDGYVAFNLFVNTVSLSEEEEKKLARSIKIYLLEAGHFNSYPIMNNSKDHTINSTYESEKEDEWSDLAMVFDNWVYAVGSIYGEEIESDSWYRS